MKTYLGDSVYIEFDGYQFVLTTENGNGPTNTIYLEPSVVSCLRDYFKSLETLRDCFKNVETQDEVVCPECGGDGRETCDNPDHGFISAAGGEIERLGCPVCGHDPDHKVPGGGSCEMCRGSGQISEIKKDISALQKEYEEEFQFVDTGIVRPDKSC